MPWYLQLFKKAPSYFWDTCFFRIKQLEKTKTLEKTQKQTPQKRPIFNKNLNPTKVQGIDGQYQDLW